MILPDRWNRQKRARGDEALLQECLYCISQCPYQIPAKITYPPLQIKVATKNMERERERDTRKLPLQRGNEKMEKDNKESEIGPKISRNRSFGFSSPLKSTSYSLSLSLSLVFSLSPTIDSPSLTLFFLFLVTVFVVMTSSNYTILKKQRRNEPKVVIRLTRVNI